MTSYYKFDMSGEEIVDIITRFGDQYLDTRHNYGKFVIKDKAPSTVPNLITFGSKMQLSTKVAAPVVPIRVQDVFLGDDNMADARSRVQVMRRGLKFL